MLKIWISRRVFYFIDILHGVRDILLSGFPQALSLLSVGFKDFLNHVKVQLKEKNPFMDSIDR